MDKVFFPSFAVRVTTDSVLEGTKGLLHGHFCGPRHHGPGFRRYEGFVARAFLRHAFSKFGIHRHFFYRVS